MIEQTTVWCTADNADKAVVDTKPDDGMIRPLDPDAQTSVVITCYNQAAFIDEAIESVYGQTLKAREIVVVDDGSKDHTAEIVARYPGVRYIRQVNQGVARARNHGLAQCTGQYVVFLDGDDRLLPDALASAVRALDERPECAFVYGYCQLITAQGMPRDADEQPFVERDHYLRLLRDNFIWMPAQVLYRREVFDRIGGFRKSADHSCDYDLYLRITQQFPVHCHDRTVSQWRQHATNTSAEFGTMLRSTMTVYRQQRAHIGTDSQRRQAYREGLRFWHDRYAGPAADKSARHFERACAEFTKGMKDLAAVARHAPGVFVRRIGRKLGNAVRRPRRADPS